MKHTLLAVAIAIAGLTGMIPRVNAAAGDSISFNMVHAAGATCLPTTSHARVTISDLGPVQKMHIEAVGLTANTPFTTFIVQHSARPFGLAWYQGEIQTDNRGRGVADFTGIFSSETFILSDSAVQMDHLGICLPIRLTPSRPVVPIS